LRIPMVGRVAKKPHFVKDYFSLISDFFS